MSAAAIAGVSGGALTVGDGLAVVPLLLFPFSPGSSCGFVAVEGSTDTSHSVTTEMTRRDQVAPLTSPTSGTRPSSPSGEGKAPTNSSRGVRTGSQRSTAAEALTYAGG